MATASLPARLTERIQQSSGALTVTRGGVPITLDDLNKSNDWRDLPGETKIHGVRIMNRKSKNKVHYHDAFIRKVAQIHEDHHAAHGHEDEYATEHQPHGRRPVHTRFGHFTGGRIVEEAGVAVSVDADLGIFEGDRSEADQWVVKALRKPSSLMFSIEVDEQPAWAGYRDDEGVTQAETLSEMLDTCTVSTGGTTTSLKESLHRSGDMSEGEIKRLTERADRADAKYEKLKEHCGSCEADIKSKQSLIDDKDARIKELEDEIAASKLVVQENERRDSIRKQADKLGLKLQESKLNRYAKFDDEELAEQLKEDAEKLTEREDSVPPSVGNDLVDEDWFDNVPDTEGSF